MTPVIAPLPLCARWDRKASGHEVCMHLPFSITGREQPFQVIVLSRLPPLVPALLLRQNLRGQGCCPCVPNATVRLHRCVAKLRKTRRLPAMIHSFCRCNAVCRVVLLPLLNCAWGFLQGMCKSLLFQFQRTALQAILIRARVR